MRAALVLPGQGSQRPGAGLPWRGTPSWAVVERAGEVVGRDVAGLLLDADADELRPTAQAQLATLLGSLLVLAALPDLPVVAVAGHSLGEVTALHAAGALGADEVVRVVAERGAAMQAAADAAPGTMAAVLGLEDDVVEQVCAGLAGVWPANVNAPRHVVVSGTLEGVAAAGPALRAAGARRVLPLQVGGAFHTPLMAPARPRLEAALSGVPWSAARAPVLSGVTAQPHGADPSALLSEQLTAPVRWRACVEALGALGVDTVLEVGPGGVLAGLVSRTLPGVRVLSLSTPEHLEQL